MAEDENENRFAHKDMLSAGLIWLRDNATYITLNVSVPDSGDGAIGSMIAGGEVTSANFVEPEYVDTVAAEAHSLGKGDVVMYVTGIVLRGLFDGAISCVCLLRATELLYMAPVTGMSVVEGRPVILGVWCISNLQPTEDCEV